jgi:hypothetical protein
MGGPYYRGPDWASTTTFYEVLGVNLFQVAGILMMGGSNDFSRRRMLGVCSLAITGAIAGCSSISDSPDENPSETPLSTRTKTPSDTPPSTTNTDTATRTPSDTPEKTPTDTPPEETPTPVPASLRLDVQNEPELPGVWTEDHDLNNFETELQLTAQTQNSTPIGGTIVEDNDSDVIGSWPGNNPTIQETTTQGIEEMQSGENSYTAKNTKHDLEAEATAETKLPDNFLLDLQPANTENTDSNIFTTYSSTEEFSHDKKTIDLKELELWHDNDYANLKEDHPEMQTFVESIDGEGGFTGDTKTKIVEAKNSPSGWIYPNSKKYPENGKFVFSEENEQEEKIGYKHAESAGEALDWLHPYLFSLEYELDETPISTEDEQYAAVIQEAFDQYNDNFNAHAWSFDLEYSEGGTHGNGLVWDETNNELRILETVANPETGELGDPQLHPLIENSNYLKPGERGYQDYWHPLRFDGSNPEPDYVPFREAKIGAADIMRGIATGAQDSDVGGEEGFIQSVGATTDYIKDGIQKLRNYNENNFEFEQFKNQSKIMNKLWEEEGNYIVGGTLENPIYAEVEDQSTLEDVWEDEDGTLTDYIDDFEDEGYEQITASNSNSLTKQISPAF